MNKEKTQNYYKEYKFSVRCKKCKIIFSKGWSWNFRSKICMDCEKVLLLKKEENEKLKKLKKL